MLRWLRQLGTSPLPLLSYVQIQVQQYLNPVVRVCAPLSPQEQASALHALGMSEYDAFKSRMLAMTGLLVAGGGSLAALTLGADAAVAFVVGGGAGETRLWIP